MDNASPARTPGVDDALPQSAEHPTDSDAQEKQQLPGLFADRAFWGMTTTQFLGAFNDNLYKQLMLLLAVGVALGAAGEAGAGGEDVQGWATFVFSLPFVLFSGFAGYLSDRYSKTPIIVLCKVAEIVVMLLGLAAFYFYDTFGMAGTWVVLFLMGTQSSFFGPPKYGVLPELFRLADLPRANGLILMTTFLAIIFGTVFAGGLKDMLAGPEGDPSSLWLGLLVCVGIAIAGTLTSLLVRKSAPAEPHLSLTTDCWTISHDMRALLKRDRALLAALLVSSVFWLVSGIAVPTVNRLGLGLLEVDATSTSLLTASIGFGIMGGALVASWLCRRGLGDQCVSIGLWGILGSLLSLGLWTGQGHLLGFYGSIIALITMGIFAAIFAIPIQVFLQSRPPGDLKGRMIATMNQANFVGILISGPIYQLFEAIAGALGWPICSVFLMMALLVLPLASLYRLKS